jgi:DNA (cytosine-5)-methyltransferase 1
MNELALFAGTGGGILGGKLLGWKCVCAVEWDAYARDVLVARQNDGCLEAFPIWDDVQTFDGKPWRGRVDVVSGGFPCQDISAAGKGAGIEGERSGMWKHMARIIGEVLPQFVFVENSPMLVGRGLGMVLGHLAEMGYDARWGIVGAHHDAAPHKRDRIWIVADSKGNGYGLGGESGDVCEKDGRSFNGLRSITAGASEKTGELADADLRRCEKQRGQMSPDIFADGGWWATEPDVGRVAHGVAARVDRLRCIGNGQVPGVVRLAWKLLR